MYKRQSQGVDDVIAYVSELLREAEEIELVSEEEMFRPELDEVQDEGLQIDIEDGVYAVSYTHLDVYKRQRHNYCVMHFF